MGNERLHSSRCVDEVEQARVGPLEVLEDHHDGAAWPRAARRTCARRRRAAPGRPRRCRSRAARGGPARSSGARTRRARDRRRSPRSSSGSSRSSSVSSRPARRRTISPSAQNVIPSPYAGLRPSCHQIGSTRPSRYFSNSQARRVLPIPPIPVTDTRRARCSRAGRMEEVLEQAQLVVAADEGGLERLRPVAAAPLRDDPQGAPGGDRGGLALEVLLAGRLEGDRRGRGPLRRLADQDRARGGGRLEPGGRVDEVAGDHPLVRGTDRDGGLAGEDAGPGGDRRPERPDRIDELEAGADSPLGVVLVGDRRAPDRHDRVADELLDRSPVAADHVAGEVEVTGQELPGVLSVAPFRERREADQIGEEDRHEAALGDGCGGRGQRARTDERGRALPAELRVGAVGRSAGRTDQRESSRAFLAELAPRLVLGAAVRADHQALRCDVWTERTAGGPPPIGAFPR